MQFDDGLSALLPSIALNLRAVPPDAARVTAFPVTEALRPRLADVWDAGQAEERGDLASGCWESHPATLDFGKREGRALLAVSPRVSGYLPGRAPPS